MSDWRTITAEQYMTGGVAAGDYDEAFIRDHDGWRREVWDVGCTTDEAGNVVTEACLGEFDGNHLGLLPSING